MSQPRILIIETSGRRGQVALAEGPTILEVRRLDEARRHARDLVPQVTDMLGRQAWQARSLQAVVVSRGPGSYTGLRVGIMSARTLAYATGCTLLGIDTFAVIARQVPADVQTVDVIADAQQERVYVQRFARQTGIFRPENPLRIIPLAQWQEERTAEASVTGPALHLFKGALPDHAVAPNLWDPQSESLLQLGLARLADGEHDDWSKLEPLYLRPSSAEEKWAALGK